MPRKRNIYDDVLATLKTYPETRNSDMKLYIRLMRNGGMTTGDSITFEQLMNGVNWKTMNNARQEVFRRERQRILSGEITPEESLLDNETISKFREDRAKEKGTHIFRQTLFDY